MNHGNALSYSEEIVPIEKLKEDDEFKTLVPPNNMKEQLVSSIAKNGQTLPIDVDSDYVILDGYTRVSILRELKYKEVKVRKWNFRSEENRATAYRLIAMLNLQRRHLEKNEVLKLLRELAEKIEKSSKEVQNYGPNGPYFAQNNKTNTKPDKTEIKSEERQKFSPTGENLEQNSEINTKPTDLELKMKQVKEEIGAKEVTDSDIQKYSIISTIPFLRQLVDDGKISLRTAYELYTKAKDKLQKIANLPPTERNQLLTTREGRKIILERDDLLNLILQHKMAVSQAINKLKAEEKLKKAKGSKPRVKEEEEDETEDEGEEIETIDREDSESNDEYDFVGEWKKAEEEEAKQQLTPQFNGQLLVKQEVAEDKVQTDFLNELRTKGFAELPFEVALVKIEGKCYVINVGALHDLEQGVEKWKELADFLSKHDIIIPGEAEGLYVIPWKLLGRCSEWK